MHTVCAEQGELLAEVWYGQIDQLLTDMEDKFDAANMLKVEADLRKCAPPPPKHAVIVA